ncbi:hypothetical protein BBK82_12420 [Lentzea guizhouensis]|uniref:Uncharacterized protein n=1 Tax=Lentzea guizhouensis TaxID=1586287 RepID=A0A1B2HGB4_9PSEU|nr:hypothetical protein [Lentzea guizhouensis]ANZ36752.1 hypothetical protein BBK82_12420 [Lentzea guizhouensis]
MDILLKILNELVLTWWFLTWVGLVVLFLAVRRWLNFRNHRKGIEGQIAALTPLAQRLGGRVVGADEATMWTAELRKPFDNEFSIAFRSKRLFDLSLDFQRGPWHVRVTQASVRYDTRGYGVRWQHEHRVEIATARIAPMRMTRVQKYDIFGNLGSAGHFKSERGFAKGSTPVTVQRADAEWSPVSLPEPMDLEFAAYSSDPVAAVRELNLDALFWLLDQEQSLPSWAQRMILTFESGVVYLNGYGELIDAEHLMVVVDTMCGLLDRMPGVRPRHPAAAV